MDRFGQKAIAILLTGATGLMATSAHAQTPTNRPVIKGQEQLSIETRRNTAFDPQGIRVGDFILSPSLTQSGAYTDNIYARKENKVDDWLYTTTPALAVKSDFVRHQLNLGLSGSFGRYQDNKDENFDDYRAMLESRIDATGQSHIPVSIGIVQDHYRRGDPEETSAEEPTVFRILKASSGIVHEGQRLALRLLGDIQKYEFDNGQDANGTVNNKDRNRTESTLYGSIGTPLEGRIAPFVYSQARDVSYSRKVDDRGFERSAQEFEGGAGASIALSDITRSDISAGYVHRTMDDARFDDVNDMAYAISLIWEPSALAAFKIDGIRKIMETTIDQFSSSIDSELRFSVNYELWPNFLLSPSLGYLEKDYQGDGDRTLERYDAGMNATYKLNQNLWLLGNYKYITQDNKGLSSATTDDYDSNTYSLSLKLQF